MPPKAALNGDPLLGAPQAPNSALLTSRRVQEVWFMSQDELNFWRQLHRDEQDTFRLFAIGYKLQFQYFGMRDL